MSPSVRKLVLTLHVVTSVGWLGAVAAFLALSIVGVSSGDAGTVRAVYLAMEAIGWSLLVPLSVTSLLTGLVQALGTKWGLFRHYWVVAKLLINLVASVVLLLYTQTLASLAEIASEARDVDDLSDPSPVLHSGAALILLVAAATLSIYKPRGQTRYGWRKQQQRRV